MTASGVEPWTATIATISDISHCSAGTILLRPCERIDYILLIISGVAKQTQENCMLVAVHGAGALLGAEAALCAKGCQTTVTALTPCAIGKVAVPALIERLAMDPVACTAVVRTLAQQAHEYLRSASQLGACRIRRRIAWILREVIRKGAVTQEDGSRTLPFPLSVTEIASMAGTERETASRALSFFLKHGILVREQGRLGVPAASPLQRPAVVPRPGGTPVEPRWSVDRARLSGRHTRRQE
jgi:CRP/FNR family transcriptional regulator